MRLEKMSPLKKIFLFVPLLLMLACNNRKPDGNNSNSGYAVTFETFGGTPIPEQRVAAGGTATRPANDPVKTDYTFTNWYTEQEGLKGLLDPLNAKPYDFSAPVNENVALNAGFLINSLPIEFELNGGTGGNLTSATSTAIMSPAKTYTYTGTGNALNSFGQALKDNFAALATTTKDGNPFQGFSLKNDAASDADLLFSKKSVSTTNPNGFDYTTVLSNIALFTARGSFARQAPAPAKLYAAYYPTPTKVSVTFYLEFSFLPGTPYDVQDIASGEKAVKPQDPTIAGFTFQDWRTLAEGIKATTDPSTSKAFDFNDPVTADVTLYAGFLINTLPITFDLDGGTGTLAQTSTTADLVATPQGPSYPYNSGATLNAFGNAIVANITALANATKGGNSFKGFRLDEGGNASDADSDANLLIKPRTPTADNPLPFELNTTNLIDILLFTTKGAKSPLQAPGATLRAVYY